MSDSILLTDVDDTVGTTVVERAFELSYLFVWSTSSSGSSYFFNVSSNICKRVQDTKLMRFLKKKKQNHAFSAADCDF